MRRVSVLSAVAGLIAALWVAPTPAAAAVRAGCRLPAFGPGTTYHPHFHPGRHPARVTNPWYPLRPGTTWIYTGRADDRASVEVIVATRRTRVLDGVRTRVVRDRLYHGDMLAERTADYFAQDRCGNVWYFGEDTAELDRAGRVIDRSGSWHAGVDGAEPGVFMPAHPHVGQRFRQEWLAGEAEDTFRVMRLDAAPFALHRRFHHALRTRETTALEPGVVDAKLYVRGIGEVQEVSVRGGSDRMTLDAILR